jgi:hypothetical protein
MNVIQEIIPILPYIIGGLILPGIIWGAQLSQRVVGLKEDINELREENKNLMNQVLELLETSYKK